MRRTMKGFSFIEVLVTVAIIGILSAIAIPAFLGQKTNADLVGDAQQNCKSLQMALETRKADAGVYGTAGGYAWTPQADGSFVVTGPDPNIAPQFGAKGSSKMTYTLVIAAGGLTYTLDAADNRAGHAGHIYGTDQNGKQTYP